MRALTWSEYASFGHLSFDASPFLGCSSFQYRQSGQKNARCDTCYATALGFPMPGVCTTAGTFDAMQSVVGRGALISESGETHPPPKDSEGFSMVSLQ